VSWFSCNHAEHDWLERSPTYSVPALATCGVGLGRKGPFHLWKGHPSTFSSFPINQKISSRHPNNSSNRPTHSNNSPHILNLPSSSSNTMPVADGKRSFFISTLKALAPVADPELHHLHLAHRTIPHNCTALPLGSCSYSYPLLSTSALSRCDRKRSVIKATNKSHPFSHVMFPSGLEKPSSTRS
jgi:hypothetical protein